MEEGGRRRGRRRGEERRQEEENLTLRRLHVDIPGLRYRMWSLNGGLFYKKKRKKSAGFEAAAAGRHGRDPERSCANRPRYTSSPGSCHAIRFTPSLPLSDRSVVVLTVRSTCTPTCWINSGLNSAVWCFNASLKRFCPRTHESGPGGATGVCPTASTGLCWSLLDSTGLYWSPLYSTGLYWSPLYSTGLYQSLHQLMFMAPLWLNPHYRHVCGTEEEKTCSEGVSLIY